MADKSFVTMGIDRKIGIKLKTGFYLETPDGEATGQVLDSEKLKEIPDKKVTFKRMISSLETNGFYLKFIEQKADGFFKTIFPTTETGGIWDKYFLEETPFEVGDVLRISITPKKKNGDTTEFIMIKIEYKWEDQVEGGD